MSRRAYHCCFCRRSKSRRGATIAEFAITAPIFLLFLMAAFEFGWLNVMRHTADNAAYEAARHVMVPGATAAEGIAKARSILNVMGVRNARINVSPGTITPTTNQVTVTIDIPFDSNALVIPRFAGGKSLTSRSTMRTERAK